MALFDPKKFIDELYARWGTAPLLKSYSPPNPDHLLTVLEAAYLASMETEEGRTLRFGLIFLGDMGDEFKQQLTRFKEPRALTSHEIRRLAPATNIDSSFIAIETLGGDPLISGIVDVGSDWTLFQKGKRPSGVGLPFNLVVTVTAPGTIKLSLADHVLFDIERGKPARECSNVLKFGPIHEFLRPGLVQLLIDAVGKDCPRDEHFLISYGGEYLRFLARTLRSVEEGGHGGAIILLREQDASELSKHITIKYETEDLPLWSELVTYVTAIFDEIETGKAVEKHSTVDQTAHDKWRKAGQARQRAENRLNDLSTFLARLTQVDGALVLTDRLRVLGFGAVIKDLSDVAPTITTCHDEACHTHTDTLTEGYGTRHRSAISICQKRDCVAFILSQDGGVKVVRNVDGAILVWPSVSLGPAAWFVTPEDHIPELRERYLKRNL